MTTKTRQQPVAIRKTRCAVYTRKSTEEGLDQEFNSLDAQRDAGEAFIASQRAEGWSCLPDHYDDGGFTGGNMDRPALKRLLGDIEAGEVDTVVVYKVDRLSRSLLDFARIMETFEKYHVSFVSVTQQFNTATSMGRLVLNVLLSFAQFEREMISERTRDKIAATRRKGKWTGGMPLLGYDVDPRGSRLIVNESEARRVRAIFELYLEHQSLIAVIQELDRRGWVNKLWKTRKGTERGGKPFSKQSLHKLLTNVTYLGKIKYKTEVHLGEHAGIVGEELWQRVQALLERNGRMGGPCARNKFGALLKGLLHCVPCGCGMSPTHATRNGTKRYTYYVCNNAQKRGWHNCPSRSIPAGEIERFVVEQIKLAGQDPALLHEVVAQARVQGKSRLEELEAERRRQNGWTSRSHLAWIMLEGSLKGFQRAPSHNGRTGPMTASVVYVGMDVHKDSIVIAVAREGREPAETWKTIPNDGNLLRKALKSLVGNGEVLRICYEAGPTGFGLCRGLRKAGLECLVVAPSLVPGKPGDRVKTDRRDARKLAHFLRSGDLTEVHVPEEAVEAIRQDRHWEGATWTQKHLDWIRTQQFAYPAQQRVLEDYLKTVEDLGERVARLTAAMEELVQDTVLAPLAKALQAFRGVSLVSAVTIAAEVGDLRRFATPRQFMSYVGLVPSEDSTGQRRRQGRITRCGNGHLRRILVEAAWHYRHVPVMSKELRRRNQGVATGVQRIAWKAQKRLNKRLFHLLQSGKSSQKAVIAVARELTGFIWAVGQEESLLAAA